MPYPRYVLPGGEKVQEVLPPPRKTIAHGRISVWFKESSNDIVGGIRWPQCIGTTGSGKIR